ncbi:hypothetical protein QYM36_001320 [Artemia franciscana]|uniref:C1q domain-containing protein n=1 Tax=Artemia franciscana TaxID=6661 RepID=A0AA88ICT5_ARTSF|nr:hypothetical protein QYM36_001320 [Artemia franciscana]
MFDLWTGTDHKVLAFPVYLSGGFANRTGVVQLLPGKMKILRAAVPWLTRISALTQHIWEQIDRAVETEEDIMKLCCEILIASCRKSEESLCLNDIRVHLFPRRKTLKSLPPTDDSFALHEKRVSLMKNREPLATAFADRGGYNSASQFVIVKLFYNDTIYLRVEEGEIYESSTRERAFTTFSGYLILPIPDQTIQEGSFQGTVVERPFNIPAFQQGYPIRPFPAYGNPGSVSQQQPFRPSQWGPFLKYHPSQSRVSFPKEQKEENAVKTEVSDSIWPFEGAVIIDDEKTDFYLQSKSPFLLLRN